MRAVFFVALSLARPRVMLAGVAVLLLVTGRAHAKDVDMCAGPHATEIPCTELGDEFMCDDLDTVYIRHDHLLSDLSSHTITIHTPLMTARKSKRYPVIRYDVQTGKLTMNGKRCKLIPEKRAPEPEPCGPAYSRPCE
jgi:hypothetical protein